MKNILVISVYLMILLILSACKKSEKSAQAEEALVSSQEIDFIAPLLDAPGFTPDAPTTPEMSETPSQQASDVHLVASKTKPAASGKVDYDLSKMNYNMISAVTFDMAMNGEKYLGKKIKIKGQFFSMVNEEVKQRFYACLIYDATACCQVGLDFVLNGNKKYPDDFPKEMSLIEITGVYETRKVGDIEYNCLVCDEITVL